MKTARKIISVFILTVFFVTTMAPVSMAQVLPWMPAPGTMVGLSPAFMPATLTGMVIHPDNPLEFDFIIHRGDEDFTKTSKEEVYTRLVKYFLASLAVPDEHQWVNLSPYEANRIIKEDFGKTEMGRDLLAQDYLLKQITSSLVYPEEGLGKKFWDRVRKESKEKFGTKDVPMDLFNKVWIVPGDVLIYEKDNTAYVLKNHLKVMLEEDYLALEKNSLVGEAIPESDANKAASELSAQIMREVILPELEKEVNGGKNFAQLRQVYSGMLLAAWYKRALKDSLLGKIYADKAKVKGVDQDPRNNEEIYNQYVEA
ncbi:MAG TPA: hypothetical protein VLJ10_00705, partial [Candidatus Bathyarchaeia archaeon]|nr:hypothetical protein [Candidatus Bathyarchaeia archaeon]